MDIKTFIQDFFDVFEEINIEDLKPDTEFRNIEEWSSLHGLATLNMIEREYMVQLNAEDFKNVSTIQELFNLVQSKK